MADGEEAENNGLGNLVSKLKGDHGVHRVLCWHALHGYWRGISPSLASSLREKQCQHPQLEHDTSLSVSSSTEIFPSSEVTPRHSEHLLRVEPVISWDSVSLFGVGLLTNPADLKAFYDGMHSALKDAGIDGVKVRHQYIWL